MTDSTFCVLCRAGEHSPSVHRREMTWVTHAAEYAHQQMVDAQHVREPAIRAAIEREGVEQVHEALEAAETEPYGAPQIEWLCRVTWTGYRRPQAADPAEWSRIVAEHTGFDHFGKPAAIVSTHLAPPLP